MRIFKNLLVALVILWGLLALMVRSATPFIADYREELAALLSGQLGVPVSVGRIGARWYGIAPLLELRGLHIGKPGEALEIDRLSIDVALGELLAGSPLDALRLTIDGMQVTLVRAETGQLRLEGVGPIDQNPQQTRKVLPLPSGLRLLNTRVVWIDRKAGKPPFEIDKVDIVLDREGTLLDLRARLQTASGNADLSAQLDGFLTTHEWDGETYLKVDNLDVADLFARYLPKEYGLYGLQLDLESWGRWRRAGRGSGQLPTARFTPAADRQGCRAAEPGPGRRGILRAATAGRIAARPERPVARIQGSSVAVWRPCPRDFGTPRRRPPDQGRRGLSAHRRPCPHPTGTHALA